jgi:4-carboxymuconolactone decarboxylase
MDECRIPLLRDDEIESELHNEMRVRLGDRPIPNLYRALANAPAMLSAWLDFAWRLRGDATTDRALRELIILRVAHLLDAPYEWSHHEVMAQAAGVASDKIAAVRSWEPSELFGPKERIILMMTDQQTSHGAVDPEVIVSLRREIGEAGTVELVLTAAFYNCVARVLNSLAIPLERSQPEG